MHSLMLMVWLQRAGRVTLISCYRRLPHYGKRYKRSRLGQTQLCRKGYSGTIGQSSSPSPPPLGSSHANPSPQTSGNEAMTCHFHRISSPRIAHIDSPERTASPSPPLLQNVLCVIRLTPKLRYNTPEKGPGKHVELNPRPSWRTL